MKGYETGPGDYIPIEPEEIAKAVPEADKTLDVEGFVPCDQVDDVYFDRPYYLAPSAPAGAKAFALIRDALAAADAVAIARSVLFRHDRRVRLEYRKTASSSAANRASVVLAAHGSVAIEYSCDCTSMRRKIMSDGPGLRGISANVLKQPRSFQTWEVELRPWVEPV